MKPSINGRFSPHGFARAASKRLIVLTLSFLALPCLLSAQTLLHRYSFVSDASDSIGGANGTLQPPTSGAAATISSGLILPGGAGSGYVSLPAGILSGTTNLTIECWTAQATQQNWAELLNFGVGGTATYLALIADNNANANHLSVGFRLNNTESDAVAGFPLPDNQEQYIAVTFNTNTLVGNLYTNGILVASTTVPNINYTPGFLGGAGGPTVNTLGVDPWNDPPFEGTIYELRIWNGVLSQRQMAASTILGPSVLVTNLTPTSATVTAGPSVIITGTEQAAATVHLQQTGSSDLPATGDATNWTSSDTSVLAVDSSGVVTGVGVGSATVSATVAGVNATSGTINVTGPPVLLHRYSFASDASDSVGGADGTLVPNAGTGGSDVTIANGLTLPGGGGPGYSGYVTLPAGILTNTTSLTLECWVTQTNGNTWAQILNFGNSQSQNMGLIPLPGRDSGHLEAGIQPNGGEIDVVSSIHFPTNSEQYVTLVFNSSTLKSALYDNGTLLVTQTYPNRNYIPGSIGGAMGTTNNVLGQDPFPDPQFQGIIHELRIWNGALSPVYEAVSAAAGPSIVVTNLTPISLTVTVTNTSMIGAQTQPATVVGDFKDASGVNVTGGATNWTSSDTSVLTVNSSGLITAQSGGGATVSATVNGVTATSATITVADTAPTITQSPANQTVVVGDTVNFTVQALGGGLSYQWSFGVTPITDATNATLTLTNVALTDAGTYSVSVTNNIGSTNLSATLSVVSSLLEHRYSFISDASDSVGGADGTLAAPNGGSAATISDGLSLPGNQNGGFGYSGYVSLPSGILTNTSSLTVECWVTQNQGNTWAEIWDFGNSGSQNFGLIPYPGNNGNNMEVAFTPHGNELDLQSGISFPNGSEQYVCLTYNKSTLTGNLYTNGTLVATRTFPDSTYTPGGIGGAGGTTENMLGNDVYGDWQFSGTVYEFRIWGGSVSPLYVAISAAAGPSIVVTNTTIQSVAVTVTNSSMIPGQTQQAVAVGTFLQVSGVTVISYATNWTSSDPSVLTVNSSGVITAVNTGSATVSATVNGVPGNSSAITVPSSPPTITQQPEATENLLIGATLNASVGSIGTPPLVYRWFFNSDATPISTTTNISTLIVPNLQTADTGSYACLVSNEDGTILSSNLTLTVVAPSVYQQAILSLNPIAYWPLNETSGTTAYDMIGGNNGTYNSIYALGATGPTNSFFGDSSYAAGFDGTSSYVDIPEGPFNITNAITTVAWVQLLAVPGFDGLFGHGDASWRMSVNPSSQPGANDGTSASGDATSPTGIFDGNWHMVAYTYTGVPGQANNGSLYVDGVLVANNTVLTAPVGDNLDVWIGGSPDYGTARLLPAYIADAAVFNQSFTAAQVQGIYNGIAVAGTQTITITHSGANVVLNWQTGTLLQTTNLLGPWTTNSAAVSPYTVPATNGNQFFRLLVSP